MSLVPKPYLVDHVSRTIKNDINLRQSTERSLVTEDWQPIPLNVGFARYDNNQWGGPDFTRDRSGVVHLRGLVSVSVAITDFKTMGFIPPSYAPRFNLLTMIPTSWGIEQFRMGGQANTGTTVGGFFMGGGTGAAILGTRAAGWCSLNNISWIAGTT